MSRTFRDNKIDSPELFRTPAVQGCRIDLYS